MTTLTFNAADMPSPSLRDANRWFFLSDQWIALRYKTLVMQGNYCQCCGEKWTPGNPLQVDHIKPRSIFPDLALDPNNLQVLCRLCNIGKGRTDQTDWRNAA